jgi:threonine dehydratase
MPRLPVSRDDVLAAAERIPSAAFTGQPTFTSRTLGEHVWLKAELFQKTGSFKARGVLNKLASLSPEEKAAWRDRDLGRESRSGARWGAAA